MKNKLKTLISFSTFLLALFSIVVISFTSLYGRAQSRVDLDDVNINGETQSDGRLTLRSRQMGELKSGLKARTSLRERILEGLPAESAAERTSKSAVVK